MLLGGVCLLVAGGEFIKWNDKEEENERWRQEFERLSRSSDAQANYNNALAENSKLNTQNSKTLYDASSPYYASNAEAENKQKKASAASVELENDIQSETWNKGVEPFLTSNAELENTIKKSEADSAKTKARNDTMQASLNEITAKLDGIPADSQLQYNAKMMKAKYPELKDLSDEELWFYRKNFNFINDNDPKTVDKVVKLDGGGYGVVHIKNGKVTGTNVVFGGPSGLASGIQVGKNVYDEMRKAVIEKYRYSKDDAIDGFSENDGNYFINPYLFELLDVNEESILNNNNVIEQRVDKAGSGLFKSNQPQGSKWNPLNWFD
jgi:hypothetical protein